MKMRDTSKPFDLPTTAALVRLRLFLEDALRRAEDGSEAGRHLALIALDGVVEYALWLVAQALVAPLERERPSFHELLGAVQVHLTEAGRDWDSAGRPGVEQLRRARNAAQHAAVVPSPDQLPLWADATFAFIDSLCRAAFDRGVGELLLAEAVRDLWLREQIEHAERAIDRGDAGVAFDFAFAALDEARSRWRGQRAVERPPGPHFTPILGPDPDAALHGQIADLDDLLEVQSFSSDLGEYVSLRRAREQAESGWTPEDQDARRALRFAVSWIVRWEVSTQGYPGERFAQWRESIEPPTKDDVEGATILRGTAALVGSPSGRRYYSVQAQLANLPERGRGDWGGDLVKCWTDAAREFGQQLPPVTFGLSLSGYLHVDFSPEAGVDADAVVSVLQRSVELAEERYQQRRDNTREREQQLRDTEAQLWSVIQDAADGEDIFAGVKVSSITRATGEYTGVNLNFHTDEPLIDLTIVADIFRDVGGSLAGAMLSQGQLTFPAFELDEAGREALSEAVTRARDEVRRRRELRAEEQRRFAAFAVRVNELLSQNGP